MHPDKAPGPDGLNPAFFQKFWHLIGDDIVAASTEWLVSGHFLDTLTDTIIVLIPKVDNPVTVKDLRPISLCNVLYKIIAKVLANRLKRLLPSVISENQSAFIKGRLITDNVLVAFELIHHMKNCTGRAGGDVALKIDISKAYDKIDWGYLEAMMVALGFDQRWIDMIMMCVRSVSYSVSVNGDEVGPIVSTCGIRQGDPLSQYLYVLCAEGLSALLTDAERRNLITGVSIRNRCPSVSHLLFADDSFLFFKATEPQCHAIRHILRVYEQASGQAVNLQKSGIFYSSNVFEVQKVILSNILEVHNPLNHSRYLGLPSMVGSNKKALFAFIRDNLWARIQNWKNKFLSRAGKEILLKAVAQAIPAYCMSVFLLPLTLCDELQRMMNSFWWGTKDDGRQKIHWLRWDRMCDKKCDGGLGFRNLRCFNLAMLAKQGWRLMNSPNSLLYRIYRGRYFPKGDFLSANLGHNPSFTWRGIHQASSVLKAGLRWRIGNGSNVSVWRDSWLPRDYDYKVENASNAIAADLRVSDLLDASHVQWDVDKVGAIVGERDAATILSIPISPSVSDRIIWHFDKKGVYSVKSGYYVASHLNRTSETVPQVNWKKIWHLHIPPKVREFLWRVLRNVLPTKQRLNQRGINVTPDCGCGLSDEHIDHALLQCATARDVWQTWGRGGDALSLSFGECLATLCRLNNTQIVEEFAMVSWRIWWARNERIWNNSSIPASIVLKQALDHLLEWQDAQRCLQQPSAQPSPASSLPPVDVLGWSCSSDAAISEADCAMGTGTVIQAPDGSFVRAITSARHGFYSPRVAEAIGLKIALEQVLQHCPGPGVVRLDAQGVVLSLRNFDSDWSEYGAVIFECQQLLQQRPDIVVVWVSRLHNRIAHRLARSSFSFSPFHVWTMIPDCIVDSF